MQSARRVGHITDWFRFVYDEIVNHDVAVAGRRRRSPLVFVIIAVAYYRNIILYYFHCFRESDVGVVSVVWCGIPYATYSLLRTKYCLLHTSTLARDNHTVHTVPLSTQ